jgi:lysyl-tRNA synthetase class 2
VTDWRPTANRAALVARAALLARARAFLTARGALEVETPALSAAAATDLHLASLGVATPDGPRFLHTSPEYPMKRLLAAGVGDCFQFTRVFRAGEAGGRHNPEFTMLEWYRVGWDHQRLMREVGELLAELLGPRAARLVVLSYAEAFRAHAGFDPHRASDAELRVAATAVGASAASLDRDACLDVIASHAVYPRLGQGCVTVVHDYPASQAALARVRPATGDEPALAERFEVFVAGLELANGYHELGDATEQRARFARDNDSRAARGLPAMPLDEHLLAALASGLPDCAGVALGFDRVVMLALDATRIEEVIAFPWSRA